MPLSGQDMVFAEALNRLRAAAEEDRAFDAAQVQLINLPEIITSAGAHWPRLRDRIRTGSVNFLKGCLGEDDIVIPAGDGFLIIFMEGAPDAIKARAQELRVLLLEFYLGEQELRRLNIEVAQVSISSEELRAIAAPPPTPSIEKSAHAPVFAPVWSARSRLIASYGCMPAQQGSDGVRLGYDREFELTGVNGENDYFDIDIRLLDAVEEASARYGEGVTRPHLGASAHMSTFQNRRARAAYLERLAKLPPYVLSRMFVRISEIEHGAPLINLADWAGLLRARVRLILLEFHHSESRAPDLSQVGVWGAGYRAPSVDHDVLEQVRQFRRWGEELRWRRVRYFVDGLQHAGLVRLAAHAGASLITSNVFWPAEEWPGGVMNAPAPSETSVRDAS